MENVLLCLACFLILRCCATSTIWRSYVDTGCDDHRRTKATPLGTTTTHLGCYSSSELVPDVRSPISIEDIRGPASLFMQERFRPHHAFTFVSDGWIRGTVPPLIGRRYVVIDYVPGSLLVLVDKHWQRAVIFKGWGKAGTPTKTPTTMRVSSTKTYTPSTPVQTTPTTTPISSTHMPSVTVSATSTRTTTTPISSTTRGSSTNSYTTTTGVQTTSTRVRISSTKQTTRVTTISSATHRHVSTVQTIPTDVSTTPAISSRTPSPTRGAVSTTTISSLTPTTPHTTRSVTRSQSVTSTTTPHTTRTTPISKLWIGIITSLVIGIVVVAGVIMGKRLVRTRGYICVRYRVDEPPDIELNVIVNEGFEEI